ncbi:hypothetical protein KEM56_000227 [Ascosphaera pollenicola]|nr:hypothetical protein KEM56_000227 [Ascosphaera pollenicola]
MSLMLAAAGHVAPEQRFLRSNVALLALRALIAHLRSNKPSSPMIDPRDVSTAFLETLVTPPNPTSWSSFKLPKSRKILELYQGLRPVQNSPLTVAAEYQKWVTKLNRSANYKTPEINPYILTPEKKSAEYSMGKNIRLIYMFPDDHSRPGELSITRHLGVGSRLKNMESRRLVERLTEAGVIMGVIPKDGEPDRNDGWVARSAVQKGPRVRYLGPTLTRIGVGVGPGFLPRQTRHVWHKYMQQNLSLEEMALVFGVIHEIVDFLEIEMKNA